MRLAPFAAVLVTACTAAPAAVPVYPAPATVRVIDGDTFVLNGETIRISNMDAPEEGGRAGCWAEARLATEATFMLQVIADGWDVAPPTIQREGEDRWGRTLARVSIDTGGLSRADVGEAIIEAGLAVPWTGRRWEWCQPVTSAPEGAGLVREKTNAFGSIAPAGEQR